MADDCCFIGRGKVYIQEINDAMDNPLLYLGNAGNLSASVEENEISQKDFTRSGSAKECSFREITSVSLNATLFCHSKENLALATYGKAVSVSGGAVTNEAHTVRALSSFIPFNKKPDLDGSFTVTNVAGSTTYVAGTDYIVGNNGLEILAGSSMVIGDAIHIDYTSVASSQIESFVDVSKEFRVVFDGQNAQSGEPLYVEMHRVKFGPASELRFITEEYGSLELTGELLKSATISADSDTSAYMIIRK